MTIPKIASSLGWTEVPEQTEGLYLQPEEVRKIERDLATNTTSAASSAEIAKRD